MCYIAKTYSGRGEMCLPVCSFFLYTHAVRLEEEYNITYVMENELNLNQNKLHSVTYSRTHEFVANYYGVGISHQQKNLEITKR